jgi:hypothetical protein
MVGYHNIYLASNGHNVAQLVKRFRPPTFISTTFKKDHANELKLINPFLEFHTQYKYKWRLIFKHKTVAYPLRDTISIVIVVVGNLLCT